MCVNLVAENFTDYFPILKLHFSLFLSHYYWDSGLNRQLYFDLRFRVWNCKLAQNPVFHSEHQAMSSLSRAVSSSVKYGWVGAAAWGKGGRRIAQLGYVSSDQWALPTPVCSVTVTGGPGILNHSWGHLKEWSLSAHFVLWAAPSLCAEAHSVHVHSLKCKHIV